MEYKIFSYLDKVVDAYKEPVNLLDGLTHDHKDTLRTIEFYSNNQFLSGNRDSLGREKPFYNVCNYRVTVAKTATDLDVKDIKFEPDSLKDAVAAMLYNKELFKYLKESNFSETLNDMGQTRPKYGELLVKKHEIDGDLKIEVVAWKNTDVDPSDIMGGVIIETHFEQPSDVAAKSDVWNEVDEFMKAHAKYSKGKPAKMEIKEISGVMPLSLDPDEEDNETNDRKFKCMCFYIGIVGKKKFYLYKEDIKDLKDKYRSLPWEKVPGRPGKGIVESGFEDQVWSNDLMISAKNATDLTTKVFITTDSNKISGNAITGVDNGHIFQMEPGRTANAMNLGASKLPEIEKLLSLWEMRYNKEASTFDANTGEAPTAGTPYSQTALLNQVANSPFEYQREVWGIFLNEILNDWILPHLKRRIKKGHLLVSDFDEEELKMIDEAIRTRESNTAIKNMLLEGKVPTEEDRISTMMGVDKALSAFGNKREIDIPDDFLNVKGKLTANITGELKNKSAILQSMAQIGKDIMATYNPNTGTYAAMEDPFLRKLYGSIIDASGTPMNSAQLKPSPTTPTQMQDLSAVAPQQPVA